MRRQALFGLAVACAALVFALVAFGLGRSRHAPTAASGPFEAASALPAGLAGRTAPQFELADARGGVLASSSLQGHPYAVTFLYTSCPDVCPLIGEEIRAALGTLGAQGSGISIVAVSVDPRGDTPEAVRTWLAYHHEPSSFHYLIGAQAELSPVWKAYSAAPQIPGDPNSSHTAAIWLVDRHGKLTALIDAGAPIAIGNLAHDFRVLIERP